MANDVFTGGHRYSVRTYQNGLLMATQWFDTTGVLDSSKAGPDSSHNITRYTKDSRGRVTQIADAAGHLSNIHYQASGLAASWEYDEWGTPRSLSGADSIPMPLRFAAREYDSETGLYYNRARYYDPVTARFISEDPIGLTGGSKLYAYANNNPVNNTDPSGNYCTINAATRLWGEFGICRRTAW